MKIGVVCYPTFGGSGIVATELGLELSRRGHDIHFITYSQPVRLDLLSDRLYYHEVSVPEYPLFRHPPYELALSSKLFDVVMHYGIDILHVHYAVPHAYTAYMTKKMLQEMGVRISVVTTLHGTDISLVGSDPLYKQAVRFSIHQSDAITAVSQSLKNDTSRIFSTKKDIEVIHNFIDLRKYNRPFADCSRSVMGCKDKKIITHISNLRAAKRPQDVIRIFYNIQKKISAKLMLVGEGPERASITRQCRDLGIMDDVVFLGNSTEIDKILRFSDLFLLPSETESFGLAALEAMASGVPVISTDVGGISEVNTQGVSGFLSPVGDVDDMTKKALFLLEDEDRLEVFKRNARNSAKRYDMHAIIPKYEAVYKKVLLA